MELMVRLDHRVTRAGLVLGVKLAFKVLKVFQVNLVSEEVIQMVQKEIEEIPLTMVYQDCQDRKA